MSNATKIDFAGFLYSQFIDVEYERLSNRQTTGSGDVKIEFREFISALSETKYNEESIWNDGKSEGET